MICDKLKINVWELIALANRHPRVNILQPGAGVGGHCIAVDPWFIVDKTPDEAKLIRTARDVNDHKPHWVVEKVRAAITDVLAANPNKTIADIKVACLGLSFKPDIDDLRESPAVQIAEQLIQEGCDVLLVEPNIVTIPDELIQTDKNLFTLYKALDTADVICVLVKHKNFISARDVIASSKHVIDTVGLLE
jgi:UDP-N-acetyl-D-mannosaminuronic acid dehydrogenase